MGEMSMPPRSGIKRRIGRSSRLGQGIEPIHSERTNWL